MSLKLKLRSKILSLNVSESWMNSRRRLLELRRRLRGRPHVVSVFLGLDDPYSYLLGNYLKELQSNYDIELRFYLTEAMTGAMRPAPELYPEYVVNDCRRLASELRIAFLDRGAEKTHHEEAQAAARSKSPCIAWAIPIFS